MMSSACVFDDIIQWLDENSNCHLLAHLSCDADADHSAWQVHSQQLSQVLRCVTNPQIPRPKSDQGSCVSYKTITELLEF